MKGKKGVTMVEMLIYLVIMGLVLTSLYGMLIYYKRALKLEESRIKIQQQARYLLTSFTSIIKDAGAMLTLANTGNYLKEAPYFNGIWPINNTQESDGIILASADLHAVSSLTSPFNPGNSNVSFEPITITEDVEPGNIWIISGKDGYLVFESDTAITQGATISSISVDTIIYYSGYLNLGNFKDLLIPHKSGESLNTGNQTTYSTGSMIAKLSEFGIFLIQQVNNDKRALMYYRKPIQEIGSGDMESHILVDDVWDMQITYGIFNQTLNTTEYYETSDSSTWGTVHQSVCTGNVDQQCIDFINSIRNKTLKEVIIDFVLVSERAVPGKQILQIPPIGDRSSWTIQGSHTFKIYTVRIKPRNFNILL